MPIVTFLYLNLTSNPFIPSSLTEMMLFLLARAKKTSEIHGFPIGKGIFYIPYHQHLTKGFTPHVYNLLSQFHILEFNESSLGP